MTTPSHRTQEQRSADTKMLLLEATIDSIIELGYIRASTTEIVKRAGVTRGAQVHHFGSKAGLITAATEYLFMRFVEEVESLSINLNDSDEDMESFLHGALEKFFYGRFFFASLELITAARTDPDLKHRLMPLTRELHFRLDKLWRHSFKTSQHSPASVETLLNMTLCLMRGMAIQSVLREDPKYYTEIIETWKEILAGFLIKRGSKNEISTIKGE